MSKIARLNTKSSRQLHQIASKWDWGDGEDLLLKIIQHPHCSLGTAIMLYWRGKPFFYCQFASRMDVPIFHLAIYDLLNQIEKSVTNNQFVDISMHYDPRTDEEDLTKLTYSNFPMKRRIPPNMFIAVTEKGITSFIDDIADSFKTTQMDFSGDFVGLRNLFSDPEEK